MTESADHPSLPLAAIPGTQAWPFITSLLLSGNEKTGCDVCTWGMASSIPCSRAAAPLKSQEDDCLLLRGPEQKPEWEGTFSQNGALVHFPR